MEGDFDYLIMGDSVQKTGIRPVKVNDDLLNIGLPGAKPLSQYLLLKRYLEHHDPPKTVFLYIDPEDPRDSFYMILRYFVNIPEFIEIFQDLTWKEREIFFLRYLASIDLRKTGLVKRDEFQGSNSEFVKTLLDNRGFMPSPRSDISLPPNYFEKNTERVTDNITMTERDMKYLDKLMKLLSEHKIDVVFLHFLEPRGLRVELEETGFNRNYNDFIRLMKRKYPEVYFAKNPILVMGNSLFGDMSHVNARGSEVFTEIFRDKIFKHFAAKKR